MREALLTEGRHVVANVQSARSPVVSKSAKAWASGKISSKDYFSRVRGSAKEAARADVAARMNGDTTSR